jgi:hypothetical protein
VPSSKVGSCDSAKAAAERDSGVDAATTGFAGARAGFAPLAGAAAAALAGGGAVPAPLCPVLWANAGAVASNKAMAMMVVLRMGNVPGGSADDAGVKISGFGKCSRMNGSGSDQKRGSQV